MNVETQLMRYGSFLHFGRIRGSSSPDVMLQSLAAVDPDATGPSDFNKRQHSKPLQALSSNKSTFNTSVKGNLTIYE